MKQKCHHGICHHDTGTPTGDVRGIATGIVLRRLVARTIAQQYAERVLQATSPFQYALSTRAGVDCVALMAKLLTDMDEDTDIGGSPDRRRLTSSGRQSARGVT